MPKIWIFAWWSWGQRWNFLTKQIMSQAVFFFLWTYFQFSVLFYRIMFALFMLESSNLLSSFSVEGYIMGSACWVWASLYWYTILCHLWMPSVLLICIVTLSYGHNLMFSMKCPISAAIREYCMNYQIVWLSIINNCVPKALFNIPPRECSFEDVQGHCISRFNVPFITCHIQLNLLTTRMILSQIQKRPHSPLVRASYGVGFFLSL